MKCRKRAVTFFALVGAVAVFLFHSQAWWPLSEEGRPCPTEARPAALGAEGASLLGDYAAPDGTEFRVRQGERGALELEVPSGPPPRSATAGGRADSGPPGDGRLVPPGTYTMERQGAMKYAVAVGGGRKRLAFAFRRGGGELSRFAVSCRAGGRNFARRFYGPETGKVFRIEPVRPVDVLRVEATNASPPVEKGDFAPPDWVDLSRAVPDIRLDIRYATRDNFMGEAFYPSATAFLQRPAAEALARAAAELRPMGFGLVVHDAYRPWAVTKMFWDATPAGQKAFVANPAKGSRHNRGTAVDASLYDIATGEPVEMPSGYDEFSPRAAAGFAGGGARERWGRDLLRCVLEREGFKVIDEEWWHFDYQCAKPYPISNASFDRIGRR